MKRVCYFDLLNVFACISVVALHCNSYVHSFHHNAAWLQALAVEVVLFTAVPIFFMLSGATLLEFRKRYSIQEFYKKRFSKTLLPYLFFSILFCVLAFFKGASFSIHDVVSVLLTGQAPYSNYWFFIPLFLYYLFTPALEKIASNSSAKGILKLVFSLFIFRSIVPVFNRAFDFSITQATPIFGYAFFAFLGYVLSKLELEKNKLVMVLLAITTLVSWGVRYAFVQGLMARDPFWFDYFAFYSVIPATFLFLAAKRLNGFICKRETLCNRLKTLSSLSFGVYLLHGFVLALLPFGHGTLTYRIACIPVVYGICCLTVFVVKRVKVLKWLVP